ncbi:pyridoxal-phosphate dependent enzyme [Actinopolymorpha sp. B9G3]|uniref:pyridoxal-phosphate dependent enzyme n=1 Tax=Actinopolymorpha sp. B9G3 TaxID=3158970 RepID=UPI0032D901AD
MYGHIADATSLPDLIRIQDKLVCVRFETMKVVSALGAVRYLLDQGHVRRGDTLVDSSSGIYAYALALACHRYEMGCHIVGSTTVDPVLKAQLAVLGATLEQVRPSQNLKLDQSLRVQRIAEILKANPSYHWMRQYHDDIHYAGYLAVADVIDASLPPTEAIAMVGGVGSGASTGALATFLRERGRSVTLVGIQPFGSITFGSEHISDPAIIIAGIGSSIPFGNVSHALYDTIHWVSFDAARAGSIDLLRRHAIFAGLSTGAAYLCARWEQHSVDGTVMFIAADTGHRYVETVFARHHDAPALDSLTPRSAASLADLALPWTRMNWAGAPAPAAAVAHSRGERDGEDESDGADAPPPSTPSRSPMPAPTSRSSC